MADSKISALTAASALTGVEQVPVVQSATTVKATIAQIATFLGFSGGILGAAKGGAGAVTGILKANGSGTVSAATSGTDYAPATSGSAILKGNGSGGFSAATAGTDYVAPSGALGAATATTINKLTLTQPATGSTLTIADGKTLTASNTLTFTGTDSSSVALGGGGTVAYTNDARFTGLAGPTTKNSNYTFTASDVGVLFRHTDTTAYTWTIDTHANAAISAGQTITGTCESTGTLTIAAPAGGSLIRLDGTAGTGNRTVAAASMFTLLNLDGSNAWGISGTALS